MATPPLEQITRTLVERFAPRRIVLFGSRARGDARPESDVDLFVEMPSALRQGPWTVEVLQAFGIRPWGMDLVVYTPEEVARLHARQDPFLAIIEVEGKVLYDAPSLVGA